MGNGYAVPSADAIDELRQILQDVLRRLRELEAMDGSQIYNTVQDLRNLVDGLLEQSEINVTGNVTGGGTGSFAAGLTSVGSAGLDLSTIPGTRQTAWQHVATGRYGYAPSTLESKTNLNQQLPFTAEDVYAVTPYVYEYVAQIAIRDDPTNEFYNPNYVVPLEIGLVAQHLIEHNMGAFVVYQPDGVTPKTIDYPLFGAIANLVAARDLNRRMTAAGL